jgi:hypothetical protein
VADGPAHQSAIYLALCIFISLPSPGVSSVVEWIGSWNHDAWIAFGTLVIAAFTVVLACIAYNQQATTRILERAYLSVQPLGLHQGEGGEWFVTIGIHNTGRLPAGDVWWSINIKRFSKHDDWRDFPLIVGA